MSKKIGICLTGKAGSGKSTIAEQLAKNDGFTRMSFAQKVKDIARDILMRPIDKTDPLDREFLQKLGTDLARKRDPDVWIKHFFTAYAQWTRFLKNRFVVDDCRFKNEADFLREHGFVIVRVEGRGYDMGALGAHASETELDEIGADFTVDNSGDIMDTMAQLRVQLKKRGVQL
ncbi:MAG: AAA family ATPase [Candidatus Babeliales bacterium]